MTTEFQEFYDPIALVVIAFLVISLFYGLGLTIREMIRELKSKKEGEGNGKR